DSKKRISTRLLKNTKICIMISEDCLSLLFHREAHNSVVKKETNHREDNKRFKVTIEKSLRNLHKNHWY
ncbi:hypothetical protein, partial [Bacillus cereus group sp. BfR-BA-01393]|uniref:hypothetical protein n=1 Tax=Bacillus cereus group sp. BfR-BA-01393 TaxID=2920330 RepID=UPI001F5AD0EB